LTLPSLYTFSEYSPDWPREFEREAARLRGYFKDEIITIHHIGSTSVPGLAAKPIIDLLPVIKTIDTADQMTGLLEKEGYRAWGEYGLAGRRFFTKDRNGYRTHNIHIYAEGHPDIERHVAFCLYLRSHEKERRDYEALKRDLFAKFPANIDHYTDGKTSFITHLELIATEWYRLKKATSESH
jgi:GrpB-like predicted nucleotidyltransferase (UPF0157 family)